MQPNTENKTNEKAKYRFPSFLFSLVLVLTISSLIAFGWYIHFLHNNFKTTIENDFRMGRLLEKVGSISDKLSVSLDIVTESHNPKWQENYWKDLSDLTAAQDEIITLNKSLYSSKFIDEMDEAIESIFIINSDILDLLERKETVKARMLLRSKEYQEISEKYQKSQKKMLIALETSIQEKIRAQEKQANTILVVVTAMILFMGIVWRMVFVSIKKWRSSLRESEKKLKRANLKAEATSEELKDSLKDIEERTKLVRLLREVAIAANEAETEKDAIQIGINEICSYTEWSIGHAYVLNQDTQQMENLNAWYLTDKKRYGPFVNVSEKLSFKKGMGLIGEVFHDGMPLWKMDVSMDASFLRKDVAEKCGIKAAFAFPINIAGQTVAVLEFYSRHVREPNSAILDLMENIGRQLSHVIMRKQFEEKARMLESVITNANDGVIITKADNINSPGPEIIYVNKAFTNITGYKAEEVIGKNPRMLQGKETNRGTLDKIRTSLETGKAFRGEIINYSKKGQKYWLSISIVPVLNEQGSITHFTAIERDITEQKHFEQALLDAKQQAEQANQAKSEFLANMSHELRTPMNGILGLCELLIDSELDDEQKDNAETIYKSGQNLLSILNDILDISKIEAGELETEDVPLDVGTTLQEIIQLFIPMAEKHNLDLIEERSKNIPSVIIGDLGKILQVLRNLINNALKFTDQGSITLISKTMTVEEREYIYFGVKDTGIGIAEDKLDKVFEKFAQADTSVTRKFGGTGLGLAICQQLVYLMGGDIGVESTQGKGSTFWFTIPLIEAKKGEKPVNLFEEKQEGSNISLPTTIKILAVDDHPVNRTFVEKILTKLGFKHIDMAEDGKEALEMIDKNNYDIVLMDCQMPEIDGYQATITLREKEKREGLPRLPVIALTANAMVGDREKCLKAGMDDYLSKPIKADKLVALLKEWVGHADEEHDHPIGDDIAAAQEPEIKDKESPVDLEHLSIFTDGKREEEKELYDMFIEYAQLSMDALKNACDNEDNEAWRQASHKIKGSAANLGANALSSACKKSEEIYEESKENKQKILYEIEEKLEDVSSFFEERMKE